MLSVDDLHEDGDGDEEKAVKVIFIEFVKLCEYMEGVISLQHTAADAAMTAPGQVKVCEDTLAHWRDNLASVARLDQPRPESTNEANIIKLYRSVLHLMHK
jgi:hypothetical protein